MKRITKEMIEDFFGWMFKSALLLLLLMGIATLIVYIDYLLVLTENYRLT